MQTQQSIALNKLFLSPLNQRQTQAGDDVSDLLPSIAAQGLLQRLVVVPAMAKKEPRGGFGVVAGGRRLLALQMLAKEGRLQAREPIDCLVIPATAGIAASIAENTQRRALHPADEFLAFRALVESGTPVEDVAATFGVTPLVVRRRLKLSALSSKLIDAYCVASCCDLTTGRDDARPAALFAKAVGLDMTAWWQATAASYFQHVAKPQVIAAVKEACGETPVAFKILKKAALAAEAERAIAGKNWLPPLLRAA